MRSRRSADRHRLQLDATCRITVRIGIAEITQSPGLPEAECVPDFEPDDMRSDPSTTCPSQSVPSGAWHMIVLAHPAFWVSELPVISKSATSLLVTIESGTSAAGIVLTLRQIHPKLNYSVLLTLSDSGSREAMICDSRCGRGASKE